MDFSGLKRKMFAFLALMFLATSALALRVGVHLLYGQGFIGGEIGKTPITTTESIPVAVVSETPVPTSPSLGAFQFLISFLIASLLMLLFLKVFKGKLFFEAFFSVAIWFGAQVVLGDFIGSPSVYILATLLVAARFLVPRVFMQDIVLIVGLAGISASLGLSFSWQSVAVILALLSVYDIVAVYRTQHMQKMFKGLAAKGAILAMVIPEKFEGFSTKLEDIKPPREDYLFLGTGDVALPIFFAVSVLPFGVLNSLFVVGGALAGLFAVHLLFNRQKERRAMPALPPIAAGAILGFLLSIA